MLKMRKVCKVKLVKIITYFFWRWIKHNYFTSLSISLNRKLRIISIQILILYEHLLSFTKSLPALWIYASLRNAELVRKEEALYLRFFTHELKIRKLWISCCEAYMQIFRFISFKGEFLWALEIRRICMRRSRFALQSRSSGFPYKSL